MHHTTESIRNLLCSKSAPIPVTIRGTRLKKGRNDIRYLDAIICDADPQGNITSMRLLKTSGDLSRWRFILEPGCIIEPEGTESKFVVTRVKYDMFPRFPLVYTTRLEEVNYGV